MPPRKTTKAAEKTKSEVDYPAYATKPATDLQERFAAWIPEVTEYDPAAAKTKLAAFNDGVRLATALRMHFQASPENQEVLAQRKAEAEEKKAAPKAAPAKRGRKPKPKAEEDIEEVDEPDEVDEEDEETEEEEEAPAPKRTTRARKAAAGATKAKGGRRKATAGADAPF
jgi:hypothetical protein